MKITLFPSMIISGSAKTLILTQAYVIRDSVWSVFRLGFRNEFVILFETSHGGCYEEKLLCLKR